MESLAGKVAIVTGAGSGLGEATALALARASVTVVLVDVRVGEVERVAGLVAEGGGEAWPRAVDVSDAEQVTRCVEDARERYGRLDFVVNNAGIDYTLPLTEITVEQWRRVIDVNLTAAFLFARAALPIMQQQGGGHIVNVASTAAKRAWANASAYHASKWGLIGFTRALGVEGRPHGIRATALVPGGMRTRFFDRLEEKPDPGNLNDPAHVAETVVFILSQPPNSVIQEILITPLTETSWP